MGRQERGAGGKQDHGARLPMFGKTWRLLD